MRTAQGLFHPKFKLSLINTTQKEDLMNKKWLTPRYLLLAGASMLLATHPALAVDMFASGKTAIKDTVGSDSTVETAILASGVVGAALTGFITKNWIGAIGGFAVGMIFWSVAAPLVGL